MLDTYRFNEAAHLLYGFFWHEFCDWYLEIIKPDIKNAHHQLVMYKILEKSLRILHPFMPFITEEIWQRLNLRTCERANLRTSIMVQPWPHIQEQMIDTKLERETQFIFGVITQIRNLRSVIEIKPKQKVTVSVYPHTKVKHKLIADNLNLISNLAKLETVEFLDSAKRPKAAVSAIAEDTDIYLHFLGFLDVAKEKQKIKEKIQELDKMGKSKEARLANHDFIKRAPREVVEKEKEGKAKIDDELKRLEKMLQELS